MAFYSEARAEGKIRQRVIEENLLDAVIGLPENLFYGTSIPACILVFKKGRKTDDVLFIDASKKDENAELKIYSGLLIKTSLAKSI